MLQTSPLHFQLFALNHPYPVFFLGAAQELLWKNTVAVEVLGSRETTDIAELLGLFELADAEIGEALTCLDETICQRISCEAGPWVGLVVDIVYGDSGSAEGAVLTLFPRSEQQSLDSVLVDANEFTEQVDKEAQGRIQDISECAELMMGSYGDENCTRKMEGIIAASRDLKRLREGTHEYLSLLFAEKLGERRPFSLVVALEHVLERAEEELSHNRMTVSFDIEEKLPKGLIGSKKQFELLLHHLICGFSRRAEALSFSCRISWDMEASLGKPALRVELKMSDFRESGEGRDLERVCESCGEERDALDVEMRVFIRLVERMGGAFYRSLRGGSRAQCVLEVGLDPVILEGSALESGQSYEANSRLSTALQEDSVDYSSFNCLVVDDNRISREMAYKLLDRIGCLRVDVADCGAAALDLFEKERYDFVFLDLQMPEMNGYELATRLWASGNCSEHLRIIAISAGAWNEVSEECALAGIEEYLQKPITRKDLQQILARSREKGRGAEQGALGLAVHDWDEVPILNLDDWSEDEDLHRRMLKMLLDDAPAALSEIEDFWKVEDLSGCEKSVHRFKGSVDVVRADRVMAVCQALLDCLRDKDLERASEIVKTLPNYYTEFVEYLERSKYLG